MSILQYGNTDASPTWTTESYLIRLTLIDTLYYPMHLEARIANPGNARDDTYSPMQKVRLRLETSDKITFYGKITSITPIEDAQYGSCLDIVAEDNLSEFITRTLSSDYSSQASYPFAAGRSDFINQIISDYVYTNNIYVTDYTTTNQKFEQSAYAPGGNILNVNFTGAGKTPLRVIYEAAQEDPWGDPTATAGFGFAHYLDSTFPDLPTVSPSTPQPHFHYFVRGGRPSAPSTNGLICRFGAASETDQIRKILPGYSFPKPPKELVTLVRIEYVTTSGSSLSKSLILVNHGAVTGGPFSVGETIEWPTGAPTDTAEVELVGPTYLILSSWTQTANLPSVNITGQSSGATTNISALHGSPPGVLREHLGREIERVIRGYHISADSEAVAQATKFLYQGGNTIQRGKFKVVRWPYIRITGTHTPAAPSGTVLTDSTKTFSDWGVRVGDVVTNTTNSVSGIITAVSGNTVTCAAGGMFWDQNDAYEIYINVRTGHRIRVDMSSSPGDLSTLNEDMLVTQIVYDEGPGVLFSEISVLRNTTSRGAGAEEGVIAKLDRDLDTALWQSTGSIGGISHSALTVNLSLPFTTTGATQVNWQNNTVVAYSNGDTFTAAAGNTGVMVAGTPYYIYADYDAETITSSTSFADTEGPNISLLAVATANSDATQDPLLVGLAHGNPTAYADSLYVNELSALTANMGVLTTGGIRIPTGTANSISTVGFTGFTLNGDRIGGYNAGVLQTEIASADGKIYAGAGSVVLDSAGVTIANGDYFIFSPPGGGVVQTLILRHHNLEESLYISQLGGAAMTGGFWIEGTYLKFTGNMRLESATGGSTLLVSSQFTSVNPTASSAIDIGSSGAYWQDIYAERAFLDTLQERQAGINIGIANGTDLISATAGGSSLGAAANNFANIYAQTLYVDTLAERGTNIGIANGTHLFAAAAGGSDIGTNANYFGTLYLGTLLDLSNIVAGTPNIKVVATSDIPTVTWGAVVETLHASAAPAGYIEILIGASARYIPFWA